MLPAAAAFAQVSKSDIDKTIEWSERWGNKIAGWWFDGCYWPNIMYQSCEAPNFGSFAEQVLAVGRELNKE